MKIGFLLLVCIVVGSQARSLDKARSKSSFLEDMRKRSFLNTVVHGCSWCGIPELPPNHNSFMQPTLIQPTLLQPALIQPTLMQPALSSDLDSAYQNLLSENFMSIL